MAPIQSSQKHDKNWGPTDGQGFGQLHSSQTPASFRPDAIVCSGVVAVSSSSTSPLSTLPFIGVPRSLLVLRGERKMCPFLSLSLSILINQEYKRRKATQMLLFSAAFAHLPINQKRCLPQELNQWVRQWEHPRSPVQDHKFNSSRNTTWSRHAYYLKKNLKNATK